MKKLKLPVVRSELKRIFADIAAVALGALLFSASMNMFLLPAKIVVGGMTGVATILNMFFGVPVGVMIIILNIPLILLNTRHFGRKFLVRTLVGIVATSLTTDFITVFPVTIMDPLLCSLLGGITMGASLGILLSRGYTTGGTDLVACLLKRRLKGVPTGTLIMISDLVIISVSALLTRDFDGVIYSVVSIFVMGKLTDMMLSGSQRAELVFIVSEHPDEVAALISEKLGRGATMLDGSGSYTGERRRVVMSVVGRRELFLLKETVSAFDPDAFVIVCQAAEVLGEGFSDKKDGMPF